MAGLGCHTSEDTSHGSIGGALGFIVGLVLSNSIEQKIVFVLICIASRSFILPYLVFRCLLVSLEDAWLWNSFAEDGGACGTMYIITEKSPAVIHVPALGEQSSAIWKMIFH